MRAAQTGGVGRWVNLSSAVELEPLVCRFCASLQTFDEGSQLAGALTCDLGLLIFKVHILPDSFTVLFVVVICQLLFEQYSPQRHFGSIEPAFVDGQTTWEF
jgi:hypothetical protein